MKYLRLPLVIGHWSLVIFLVFGCLGSCCAAGVVDAAPAAVLGGAWPASLAHGAASAFGIEPRLAQLPDPKSNEAIGWVIGVIVALILTAGGVIAAIIGGLTLIEKIKGTTKVHATTKATDDGPGRVEFDLHVTGLREDVADLKAMQKEMLGELKLFSGDQYKARGRMHQRLNRLENAMHFWAGKLAGQGDEDAKRLQQLLESGHMDEEGQS